MLPALSHTLIKKIRAHLAHDGVIAYATASCFGLGCDPDNINAINKILSIKKRPRSKGLIVIADRFERLAAFIKPLTIEQRKMALSKWPGPHTWLMPASHRASSALRGRNRKIAVRVDAHPDAVRLCKALRMALVSTSANVSGRRPVKTYHECVGQFGNIALVVPGRIGRSKSPSTIQDFESDRVLRK
ncbi:MAG: Sua5/YciO/YrdC/YwlC family protein [Burkholderiales bacterium]